MDMRLPDEAYEFSDDEFVARVSDMAERLGSPLVPWQRAALDKMCEKGPDGGFAHGQVVPSFGRQREAP